MPEYLVEQIRAAKADDLNSGVWLMLYHAEQRPPHIILVIAGEYFSISVKGNKNRESISGLLRNIQQKNHRVLAIKVKVTGSPESLQQKAFSIFSSYSTPVAGSVSCLFPVRQFFAETIAADLSTSSFVFELFSMLKSAGRIGTSIHFNMVDLLEADHTFALKTYSADDINRCIEGFSNEENHA